MQITGEVTLRGYTKKENKEWIAVCIDLNLVAQGATKDEASRELFNLICEYIRYVCEEYPDQIERYIPRLAPQDLIDEFDGIFAKSFAPKKKASGRGSLARLNNIVLDPNAYPLCPA